MARAISEAGRAPKTIHLLAFIDDENYRRGILVQLNRLEGRHGLARAVFHGKRGELRQAYREGQEDQLGALGLVLNAIVLWNTRYMDAALRKLRADGMEVPDEDVERLSPLLHGHVNLLGRYHFAVPEAVLRGELRPLRDPDDPDEILNTGVATGLRGSPFHRDHRRPGSRSVVGHGRGSIGPSAHSVSCQPEITASVSLQTKQKASMRSSLRFMTHIRPRHGSRPSSC